MICAVCHEKRGNDYEQALPQATHVLDLRDGHRPKDGRTIHLTERRS